MKKITTIESLWHRCIKTGRMEQRKPTESEQEAIDLGELGREEAGRRRIKCSTKAKITKNDTDGLVIRLNKKRTEHVPHMLSCRRDVEDALHCVHKNYQGMDSYWLASEHPDLFWMIRYHWPDDSDVDTTLLQTLGFTRKRRRRGTVSKFTYEQEERSFSFAEDEEDPGVLPENEPEDNEQLEEDPDFAI